MNSKFVIIIIASIVLICCVLIACLGFFGTSYYLLKPTLTSEINVNLPSRSATATPAPTAEIVRDPVEQGADETFKTLEENDVPINDPVELAKKFLGVTDVPSMIPSPIPQLNERRTFWANNSDTDETFQFQAVCRLVGKHAYWWIEDGVEYDQNALEKIAAAFDEKIYPTTREFFGSEWSPGIDGDPVLYIYYVRNLGSGVGGYFSSPDELPPAVRKNKDSNAHEAFLINADGEQLEDEYTYGTLAHEFQHMIHWYKDRNETSYLNEGFSELSSFLNGYGDFGQEYAYIENPDMQFNDWGADVNMNGPHYAASFLFFTYFLDRFGEKVTQALVAEEKNGLDSIDHVMQDMNIVDSQSGKIIGADDVFQDWSVTNFLNNKAYGDGRYFYNNYNDTMKTSPTEVIKTCPSSFMDRTLNQYGVQYIKITCKGDHTLSFEGSTMVKVMPEDPYSGKYMFWSNKGDESDMYLEHEFDLTGVTSPIEISYWTWFDIEEGYDYAYLTASEDGKTWKILKTPTGTDKDPSGNSYGWGYTSLSNGWIQEHVDLSQFAGKKIKLRFEYVTDAAANGEGMLLDDISLTALNYNTDFEDGDGGWKGEGFVRIQNILPQKFRIAVITEGKNKSVKNLELTSEQTLDVPFSIGGDIKDVVIVVSGTTRMTRIPAGYRFSIK